MKSSWEQTKKQSSYHFNSKEWDYRWDTILGLGRFSGDWSDELNQVIQSAYPVNWSTIDLGDPRKKYGTIPEHANNQSIITRVTWELTPIFKKMSDLFCLDDCSSRLHVQMPGDLLNIHLDRLHISYPDVWPKVMRIMIQLTDWEMGHFFEFGNYQWSKWSAGDIATFDWKHVPHCSANAGHKPRVTLQVTGIKTPETERFLFELKNKTSWSINE